LNKGVRRRRWGNVVIQMCIQHDLRLEMRPTKSTELKKSLARVSLKTSNKAI